MQNLNLYNYYDKSLADIHKDYIEALNAKKPQVKKRTSSGKLIAAAVFAVLLVLAGGGFIVYYKMFNKVEPTKRYAKPKGPDLRSTEEKLGYVKVQIFEFVDEPLISTPTDDDKYESPIAAKVRELAEAEAQKQKKERLTVYDEKKKIVDAVDKTIPKKPEKIAMTTSTPQKTIKTYAVVFEDLNKEQYEFVIKAGTIFKMKPDLLSSNPDLTTVWRLYRVGGVGDVLIGGQKAEFIKDFDNKEDAVQFAKDNKIQSIIRSEDINSGTYTVKLCCSILENAKKFAENSNILNKTIKIIQEK